MSRNQEELIGQIAEAADELLREEVAGRVIDDYTWPRLEELGRALGMCEGDIADALVELRLRRAVE